MYRILQNLQFFPYFCLKQLNTLFVQGKSTHQWNNLLFESCTAIMPLVLWDVLILKDLVENFISSQLFTFHIFLG